MFFKVCFSVSCQVLVPSAILWLISVVLMLIYFVVSLVPRVQTRMIMSEKPTDGTIAMFYGDIDDGDILSAEDHISHLPTLPNAVSLFTCLNFALLKEYAF